MISLLLKFQDFKKIRHPSAEFQKEKALFTSEFRTVILELQTLMQTESTATIHGPSLSYDRNAALRGANIFGISQKAYKTTFSILEAFERFDNYTQSATITKENAKKLKKIEINLEKNLHQKIFALKNIKECEEQEKAELPKIMESERQG